MIELLGYTKLRHLHILQNRYSPKDTTIRLVMLVCHMTFQISHLRYDEMCVLIKVFDLQPKRSSWVKMRKNNPQLRVHFEIESHKTTDLLLPIDILEHSAIPCHSIVLDNPNTEVSQDDARTHIQFRRRWQNDFFSQIPLLLIRRFHRPRYSLTARSSTRRYEFTLSKV